MLHREQWLIAAAALSALGVFYARTGNRQARPSDTVATELPASRQTFDSRDVRRDVQAPKQRVTKTETPLPVEGGGAEEPDVEPGASENVGAPEPTELERVQLLRLPVISAIRSPQPTLAARHDAMRDALARSGPSREPWTEAAIETFLGWDAALPADAERVLDERNLRCFQAGCEITLTFASQAAYERTASAFRDLAETGHVTGGRVQTPPTSENGRITARWMWLRPEP